MFPQVLSELFSSVFEEDGLSAPLPSRQTGPSSRLKPSSLLNSLPPSYSTPGSSKVSAHTQLVSSCTSKYGQAQYGIELSSSVNSYAVFRMLHNSYSRQMSYSVSHSHLLCGHAYRTPVPPCLRVVRGAWALAAPLCPLAKLTASLRTPRVCRRSSRHCHAPPASRGRALRSTGTPPPANTFGQVRFTLDLEILLSS